MRSAQAGWVQQAVALNQGSVAAVVIRSSDAVPVILTQLRINKRLHAAQLELCCRTAFLPASVLPAASRDFLNASPGSR